MPKKPMRSSGVEETRPAGVVHEEPMPLRVVASVRSGYSERDVEAWQIAYSINAVLLVWMNLTTATTAWIAKSKVRPA